MLVLLSSEISVCRSVFGQVSPGLGGSLTRDQKRISVGDCILKRHCSGINQRLTIVNKAVIATETFKKARVYESCRAEPSTRHMETGYVTAATGANICDLHRVSRDAIRQKRSRTLVDHKGRCLNIYPPKFGLASPSPVQLLLHKVHK
ncbi:hypothetical protein HanPI659440_Chr09g0327921 [Helianthus annuus]|nr:hypothetical protein HanPI659440_Chr09g0327921 [Helianthus annuus]